VWLDPHASSGGRSVGMTVAEPYVDHVLSGHDLASLESFAALLPTLS
jgi:uncharacterized protein